MTSLALAGVSHVVLDMDGTIYRGSTLFDCTLPFLAGLADLGIGHTFITNNSSRGTDDYVSKLAGLGIAASPAQVYTSTDAVVEHLVTKLPNVRRLWVLGTPSMVRHLVAAGYAIDDQHPEAVVVGYDTTLDYERLCRTAWWISRQLPFIASHPDLVCPTDQPTLLVDCGAVCACLAAATGRQPVVLGKPDPQMIAGVCRRHRLEPRQIAVVGDRLYTDVAMGQRAGAVSVLVLTGEATAEEAARFTPPPDFVMSHIGELGDRLAAARGLEPRLRRPNKPVASHTGKDRRS